MKSTSVVLFILGAVTAGCLYYVPSSSYWNEGSIFFIASCLIFLIVGIFNLIFMIDKKTNKKLLLIHIAPLVLYLAMGVYYAVVFGKMGEFSLSVILYILLAPLIYTIPHILSFGAHLTHIEYITKNQVKDKRIADLEIEIERLKERI